MNQILLDAGAKALFLFSLMLDVQVMQTSDSPFFPAWPSGKSLLLLFSSFYPTFFTAIVHSPICLHRACCFSEK